MQWLPVKDTFSNVYHIFSGVINDKKMTQNVNLQHSESNQVILINTEEETQVVSGMTLTSEPLSLKTPLRVNELAYVMCESVPLETLSVAVIAVTQSTIYAHHYPRIKSATLSVQIVSLPASI